MNRLLTIAINRYAKGWDDLQGPERDVDALNRVLREHYGFQDEHCLDLRNEKATMRNIMAALRSLADCPASDSLVVYYAGHGYQDSFDETGFWVPHDGGTDELVRVNWIPNNTIRATLLKLPFRHILVFCDSCFSGTIFAKRNLNQHRGDPEFVRNAMRKRSREIITSGSDGPVADVALGGHSPFAFHLLKTLTDCPYEDGWLDAHRLYDHIRSGVTDQEPLAGTLPSAGHQTGGAFFFRLVAAGERAKREAARQRKAAAEAERRKQAEEAGRTRKEELRKEQEAEKRRKAEERIAQEGADLARQPEAVRGARFLRLTAAYWLLVALLRWTVACALLAGLIAVAVLLLGSGFRFLQRAHESRSAVASELTRKVDLGGGVELGLVLVKPGRFRMGSEDGDSNEKPVHEVRIRDGFWLGRYEMTQGEFKAVMGRNPSKFKGDRNPVEEVSWNDAIVFCERLTERERAAGQLPHGYEYRLPTEAEWEYAARGGTESRGFIYAGSSNAEEVAWHEDNSGRQTHPVGGKEPNELGLYDMSGNVWEWCLDWHGEYLVGAATDPAGAGLGSYRVYRGGSWVINAGNCRSANRDWNTPTYSSYYLGFRVALAPVR